MYTIKRAAELTGISVPTLRAWERRYEIVSPERTEAGYRVYDDAALQALSLMSALVADGWTPSLAADEVRRRRETGEVGEMSAPSAVDPGPGGSDVREALAGLDLVGPASRMDARAVADVLDDAFSRASFEVVVDSWLMPALTEVGDAWADGRITVAGEHLVAYAVQRRLAAMFEVAGGRAGGAPRVVVGLPSGARHELGLLAFAVAARRAGLGVVYVGADLPPTDWAAAVTEHRSDAAVLAVPTPSDVRAMRRVLAELPDDDAKLLIAVGGGQQDRAPEGCLRLGHEIGPAADRLATALRTPT